MLASMLTIMVSSTIIPGGGVEAAATCSYLPDKSQLACSLPSPTNLTTVLGEEEEEEGRTLSLVLTCPEAASTSTSSLDILPMSSLDSLPRMPHLEKLQMEGCPASPLPQLGALLPGLQQLKVQGVDLNDAKSCEAPNALAGGGVGLGDRALQGLHQLRHLEVTGSGLRSLDRSTFCPGLALASIISVNLSHNCLSSLPPLNCLSSLERLSVEWNQLMELGTRLPLPSLTSLHLGHNHLAFP